MDADEVKKLEMHLDTYMAEIIVKAAIGGEFSVPYRELLETMAGGVKAYEMLLSNIEKETEMQVIKHNA